VKTLFLVPVIAILISCTSQSAPPVLKGQVIAVGPMALARATHTATPLPDGRVLVAGGCTTAGCGGTAEGGRTEIFDPATHLFEAGPSMGQPRMGHTATRLPDGRVLFAGGWPAENRAPLAHAEIYDPATSRFTATGGMGSQRGGHTATLLRDGRVLLVGGESGRAALSTVEAYDPATGQFTQLASLPGPRAAHGAALLGNGQVLVAGGRSQTGHGNGILDTTLLFDPSSGTWRAAAKLSRLKYKLAVAPLPDGGALVIGGQSSDEAAARLTETEIFDPTTSSFRPGPTMAEPRYKISDAVAVLPDGRLVIAGNTGVEVYSAGNLVRLNLPSDAQERQFPAVAPLPNGQVLITGGYSELTQPTASALLATP
jgi:hypothetical protein